MSNLITISATLLTASLASGFTLQPTSPSGPRGLTSAQLASSGSVMEPLPLLPATKQYRGATVRANTDQETLNIPDEEYDEFFQLVDNLLWDSDEGEGRQFRRGMKFGVEKLLWTNLGLKFNLRGGHSYHKVGLE